MRSVVDPLASGVRVSTKTAGNHDQARTTNKITFHSPTDPKVFLIPKSFPKMSGQKPRSGMVKPSKSSEIFWFRALRFEFSECRRKTLASASLPLDLPLPETNRFTINTPTCLTLHRFTIPESTSLLNPLPNFETEIAAETEPTGFPLCVLCG
jgi:hypothetical protein